MRRRQGTHRETGGLGDSAARPWPPSARSPLPTPPASRTWAPLDFTVFHTGRRRPGASAGCARRVASPRVLSSVPPQGEVPGRHTCVGGGHAIGAAPARPRVRHPHHVRAKPALTCQRAQQSARGGCNSSLGAFCGMCVGCLCHACRRLPLLSLVGDVSSACERACIVMLKWFHRARHSLTLLPSSQADRPRHYLTLFTAGRPTAQENPRRTLTCVASVQWQRLVAV